MRKAFMKTMSQPSGSYEFCQNLSGAVAVPVTVWQCQWRCQLTFFLKMTRRLFPLVAIALVVGWYLYLEGFSRALFLIVPTKWLPTAERPLPFPFPSWSPLPLSLPSFPLPLLNKLFVAQLWHKMSPCGSFFHIDEDVALQEMHEGLSPNGIVT